ncbi:hypothetical protein [Mangrovivirga cuniculi]|uniref:DUF2953 domain-containing protein n=1 Tax=Mangrovivirga cuniculi TaxID=2715131 RepID=A0A4D7JLC9_9BACT|nr:hypothetical protein [Mangrovivirga cuniculi]QCK15703.1 hypothetical protein DCC35_13595 [Mangrovivirga cuniculi]
MILIINKSYFDMYIHIMIWVIYIILVIIVLLAVMVGWVLLTTLIINVNTRQDEYSLHLTGLFKAKLEIKELNPIIHLNTLVGNFNVKPLEVKKTQKIQEPEKKKEIKHSGKRKGKSPRAIKRFAIHALNTFRIKHLKVNIDTDDYVMNAQLFPLFYLISSPRRQTEINFTGRNELELIIQNRLIRLVRPAWKFIRSK